MNLSMRCVRLAVVLVTCAVTVRGGYGKGTGRRGPIQDGNTLKGYEYLKKYGYIEKNPGKDGTIGISFEKTVKAVKNLQKFAGLSETGEIDNATLELIERPRCGVKDPVIDSEEEEDANGLGHRRQRRYVAAGRPYQWNKNDLTYKVINYPSEPSTITRQQVDTDVADAFELWSDVTPLTFRSVENENAADIRLMFGRQNHARVVGDPSFDGPGGTLAHAFSPHSNWGATDGDAHFDEDETYTHGVKTGVNFFYTAAHEIGHTLGLDHSDVANSLMWPWGRTYSPEFRLSRDDIDGIQSIYGVNPNPPVAPTTPPPAFCQKIFSSVILIGGEIYAFSADKLWRFDVTDGSLLTDPRGENSRTYFPHLPRDVSAGYERWYDGKIFFFKGRNYWIYKIARISPPLFYQDHVGAADDDDDEEAFPRSVSELSLPKKITAALHIAEVGRTYLFKAKQTYVIDEFEDRLEKIVKTRTEFPGAKLFPSAAFYSQGYTYLLYEHTQGADYYRFKWDPTREVFVEMAGYPREFFRDVLHCP